MPIRCCALAIVALFIGGETFSAEGFKAPRCEIIPLPDQQVSFRIDGIEKTRWHFGTNSPRPYFFPFNGPSGETLTRMGHPGAPNHDHHRSVWFAHNAVNDTIYWSDLSQARIRQKLWYAYRDGQDEAIMATLAGWYDGAGEEAMEQDTVAALIPMADGEHALELQVTFRPAKGKKSVRLEKTNFGLLAVRVAKTISVHFGGGTIRNSEGRVGEANIFGKPARWMDYSGPIMVGTGLQRQAVTEGITFFDHPANPRHPVSWHVREDGWMGASFSMHEPLEVTHEQPLTLRYLLHAHRGDYDQKRAAVVAEDFEKRTQFEVSKSRRRHQQYEVGRLRP
jgi:hypothetical protein